MFHLTKSEVETLETINGFRDMLVENRRGHEAKLSEFHNDMEPRSSFYARTRRAWNQIQRWRRLRNKVARLPENDQTNKIDRELGGYLDGAEQFEGIYAAYLYPTRELSIEEAIKREFQSVAQNAKEVLDMEALDQLPVRINRIRK